MHGKTYRSNRSGDREILKKVAYANLSDVGQVRSENQDFMGKFPEDDVDLASPQGQLFIVADGMGGHKGGRDASRLAVDTIEQVYSLSENSDVANNLKRAFQQANERIYKMSLENPKLVGMGTTCIALALHKNQGTIAHIGDSRIYRISKRKITQLTQDHSKVAEMERRGLLTAEEARHHPERSHLYRALGTKPEAEVDVIDDISLSDNDTFLMCTDGLFNLVEKEELKEIVLSYPPDEACKRLVDLANERGGHDNITLQIIHVKDTDSLLGRIFNR